MNKFLRALLEHKKSELTKSIETQGHAIDYARNQLKEKERRKTEMLYERGQINQLLTEESSK